MGSRLGVTLTGVFVLVNHPNLQEAPKNPDRWTPALPRECRPQGALASHSKHNPDHGVSAGLRAKPNPDGSLRPKTSHAPNTSSSGLTRVTSTGTPPTGKTFQVEALSV